MTALAEELARRIVREGPITMAEYMAECLINPEHGYYATRDPLGAGGDFITAPEISQMFGEMIGLFFAQAWLDRDRPGRIVLAELGPGRGTLMADLLRAASAVPGFCDAAEVHLVEASPVLKRVQAETSPVPVIHHDDMSSLPEGPLFLIANEFFDALPVRQFQRDGDGWRERLVGVGPEGALTLGLSDPVSPEVLGHRTEDTRDGDIVEICPAGDTVAGEIGRRVSRQGGVALVIDYGDWRSLGDTLQAVRAHEPVEILNAPGSADLTCHVDFEALARAARPARHTRLASQGVFLERLGITARANALAGAGGGGRASEVAAAHRRLTHPDEMGTLFKAMAFLHPDEPTPPGFDA